MPDWNFAQWFMASQIITCMGGGLGFWLMGKPWHGVIWALYSTANYGWFMIASGRQ